ncbi:MAG: 3-hydroxybutyryl-CoA dehydrogenase [Actinomycetota bacterium]|nr:3-hydroxybutyryl-CoA dehydrogenase [Actinomycetota bacterium]
MTIKRVGVIGSGIMGSGIAEVVTRSGFEVFLRSRSRRSADKSLARLSKSLARQVDKSKLDADERDECLSRVRIVADLRELDLCDLVIESVVEDLDVKVDLFAELDRVCPDETVLVTNTSTLPIVSLAMATGRPDRVCGMHFFNPAPVMPLVEIVPALTTSDTTLAAVRSFAEDCGKAPVLVADRAGFIVNALLFPYLNSAIGMLEQGIASKADIDAAMRGGCGFPMGPFELLDLVGLDTRLSILEVLHAERGDPGSRPAPLLQRMVTARQLGRKTRQGFYPYPAADSPTAPSPSGTSTS